MLHVSPILHGSKNPHLYNGILLVDLPEGNFRNPFAVPCVHFAALRLVRSNALRSARLPSDSLRSSSAHVSGELPASQLPCFRWLKNPASNSHFKKHNKTATFIQFSTTFLRWGQAPLPILHPSPFACRRQSAIESLSVCPATLTCQSQLRRVETRFVSR